MSIAQDVFFIPDDIDTGLATGVYSRIGSVVRWAIGPNKGQIVKHLKSIDLLATEQAQGVGVKALQFVKQHKKGTIIAVAGAATVGTGVWVYNKVKNLESKVVKEFRAALRVYIEAIRNGKMDVEKINNLMDRLDALKAHKDYSKISIQLTTEELEILVGQIYDYTIRLTEDNNISLTDEERIFSKSKSSDSIINLQSYLRTQKRIFEEVA
ncbi:hypothetical protein HMPREF0379_0587 [[Eubacterium] yurii subsp. margaretiae ATCC 43715]|nr:hypothetical protein HMPREF0379_0587 [[Eubacterium] yurii subsp. margaretiae ATCC 43715]